MPSDRHGRDPAGTLQVQPVQKYSIERPATSGLTGHYARSCSPGPANQAQIPAVVLGEPEAVWDPELGRFDKTISHCSEKWR